MIKIVKNFSWRKS